MPVSKQTKANLQRHCWTGRNNWGIKANSKCTFNTFQILTQFLTIFFLGTNISCLRPFHFSDPFTQKKSKSVFGGEGSLWKGMHDNTEHSSMSQTQEGRRHSGKYQGKWDLHKMLRFSISKYLTSKLNTPLCCHYDYEYQKAFIFDILLTLDDKLGFFPISFFFAVCLNQKGKKKKKPQFR